MKLPAALAFLALVLSACSSGYTQEELDAAIAEAVEQALAEQDAETGTTTSSTSTLAPTTTLSPTTTTSALVTTTTSGIVEYDDGDPRSVDAVSGNENPTLGVGAPGEISYLVAAHTTTSSGSTYVFVLLRNNTPDLARGVEAAVTVRAPTGNLLASGEIGDVYPYRIEPGEIGFGEIFLSGVELPGDVEFEFQWSTTDIPENRDDQVDLVVTEHVLQGGQIVAIVENNTASTVELVEVGAICIMESGGIAWFNEAFVDFDVLEPGTTSPVTVNMNDQPCPYYLISAQGFK